MKSIRDDFRIKRLKDKMREYNVDYLILRLPENVLYSTGYCRYLCINGDLIADSRYK